MNAFDPAAPIFRQVRRKGPATWIALSLICLLAPFAALAGGTPAGDEIWGPGKPRPTGAQAGSPRRPTRVEAGTSRLPRQQYDIPESLQHALFRASDDQTFLEATLEVEKYKLELELRFLAQDLARIQSAPGVAKVPADGAELLEFRNWIGLSTSIARRSLPAVSSAARNLQGGR